MSQRVFVAAIIVLAALGIAFPVLAMTAGGTQPQAPTNSTTVDPTSSRSATVPTTDTTVVTVQATPSTERRRSAGSFDDSSGRSRVRSADDSPHPSDDRCCDDSRGCDSGHAVVGDHSHDDDSSHEFDDTDDDSYDDSGRRGVDRTGGSDDDSFDDD